MMKRILMTMLAVMILSISAGAVEISDELLDAADSTTREIAEQRPLRRLTVSLSTKERPEWCSVA